MDRYYDEMPRLREETRRERRQAFVEAAWRCAATRGYHAMTVDDVCAEAGFSKGAFYVHFASKRDLLVAIIDEDVSSLRRIAESLDRRLGPIESLRSLAQAMLQQGDDPARVQVRADVWGAVIDDPAIREQVKRAVEERRRLLRIWIEEAAAAGEIATPVPANALASVLLALNDGLTLHHALDRTGFRWANVRVAIDALLDGIRTR